MARTNNADIVDQRRRRVAALRLRGLSQREITQALAEEGILSERTGEPYSHVTIGRDLQALREEWRAEALADIDQHSAAILAETRLLRRQAWERGDLDTVLKALKAERELLGLDAPKRVDVRHTMEERARKIADQYGLDPNRVLAEAESIIRAIRP